MKIIHLFEGYKEAEADFIKFADLNSVRQTIADYKLLVNKNQFQGQERNIDFWRKQGWEAFAQRVQMTLSQPTKTQIKRKQIVGKSIFVNETDTWLIVVPLDKDASCFYGKNTSWCTTVPTASQFENYFYDRSIMLIYCINKETGSKWAIASHVGVNDIEMFDQGDNPISGGAFQSATGLDPIEIVKQSMVVAYPRAEVERKDYKSIIDKLTQLYQNGRFRPRNESIEDMLSKTKHIKLIRYYLQANGKDKYPDAMALAAISNDSDGINYFKYQENPSASFIKSAIKINPEIAKYIPNLDESSQLQLIDRSIENIRYIQNPTEKVQMEVLDIDPSYLEYIRGVTPDAEEFAIEKDPTVIQFAHWFSEASQMRAVEHNSSLLKYCYKPSDEVILAAVTDDPRTANYVERERFTPELQTKIINENLEAIEYLPRLSPDVMIYIVKKNPLSIINIIDSGNIHPEDIPDECYNYAILDAETPFDQSIIFDKIQHYAPLDALWSGIGKKWLEFIKEETDLLSELTGQELEYEVKYMYNSTTLDEMRDFMKRVYAAKDVSPELEEGSNEIAKFISHLKSLLYK
jgi:hypothetical protein